MYYTEMTDELAERFSSLLYDDSSESIEHAVTTVAAEMGMSGKDSDSPLAVMAKHSAVAKMVEDVMSGLRKGTLVPKADKPEILDYDEPDSDEEIRLVSDEDLAAMEKEATDTSDLEDGETYEEGDPEWDAPINAPVTEGMKQWL